MLRTTTRRVLLVVTVVLSIGFAGIGTLHGVAAHADGALTVQSNITYMTETNGAPQQLDAYVPMVKPTASPSVIFVHGGGWNGGDKSDWATNASDLTAKMGWPTFSVNYILNAPNAWWEEYWDVAQAIAWVKAHAADYGIDPARIGVVGDSAGGHLAAFAATYPSTVDSPYRVKAAAAWSGIFDLPLAAKDAGCQKTPCTSTGTGIQYVGWAAQTNLLKATYAQQPGRWASASPVNQIDSSDTAPMLLVNSSSEMVPVDQVNALSSKLTAGSILVQTLIIPGTAHGTAMQAKAWPVTVQFLIQNL